METLTAATAAAIAPAAIAGFGDAMLRDAWAAIQAGEGKAVVAARLGTTRRKLRQALKEAGLYERSNASADPEARRTNRATRRATRRAAAAAAAAAAAGADTTSEAAPAPVVDVPAAVAEVEAAAAEIEARLAQIAQLSTVEVRTLARRYGIKKLGDRPVGSAAKAVIIEAIRAELYAH